MLCKEDIFRSLPKPVLALRRDTTICNFMLFFFPLFPFLFLLSSHVLFPVFLIKMLSDPKPTKEFSTDDLGAV
jgi:hypothetical protein